MKSSRGKQALVRRAQWTQAMSRNERRNEMARRSVGRSDLALLLCSIDHTARTMHQTMPAELKPLQGEPLVTGIVERLELEDFAQQLIEDPSWVAMRTRWIRLGWRGATDETFNDTFVRATAERMAEFHAGSVRDIVLDAEMVKHSATMQKTMTQAFKERLDAEYARLPRAADSVEPATAPILQAAETALASEGRAQRIGEARDAIKALTRDEQLEIIEEVQRREAVDAKIRSLTPPVETRQVEVDVDPAQFVAKYTDHGLMRAGRILWEKTYAIGLTDDQAHDKLNVGDDHNGLMSRFAAKWAVHAFQRLMTSHTFAAALMCSDVQREVLEGIEKQWDAFMVLIPNGMLVAEGHEFSRVLVATYSYGADLILLSVNATGVVRSPSLKAKSLPELLACQESDLEDDSNVSSMARRCLVMAKRLVAGLLLNLQHPPNYKIRKVEERPKSKGREAEPEHRIVSVGKSLEIDCRAAIKDYIEHGPKKGRKHSPPTVQVMVRGHYKRQPCGPRGMDRKVIWIEPFWRGPEAALIQTRAAKVSQEG